MKPPSLAAILIAMIQFVQYALPCRSGIPKNYATVGHPSQNKVSPHTRIIS
jgi:hypothetical protein